MFKKLFYPFALIILLSACSKNEPTDNEQPSNLGQFAEYLNSVSSGIISKTDPIIITFNNDIDGIEAGSEASSKLFSISPKVKLKANWQSQSVLILEPEEHLESGETYQVTIHLSQLFELDDDFPREFTFPIQTIPLSYSVEFDKLLNANDEDYTIVQYKGSIKTSDWVDNDAVEEMLTAKFKGESLAISYEHGPKQKNHTFFIKGIKRQKEDSQLNVSWSGEPLKINDEGNTVLEIPSKDSFKVLSAQIEREGAPYISVVFSDPINPNQVLEDGLQVKGHNIRTTVDQNTLKIYALGKDFSGKLNLKVLTNLKNSRGLGLDKAASFELQVSTYKPQVKSVAGDGYIIPSSNKLVLPLQVVGVKALEVTVIRIFPNNIHQYLQNNNLGGNYNLRRVGRPIVKKVIPLIKAGITDYYSWSSISLDLNDIFRAEPGAIYQVDVDFSMDMAVYNCQGMDANEQIEEISEDPRTLDWDDTYNDYYYYDYDWSQRENPCHNMYYRQGRGVEQILFASDIGLTAKLAENQKLHLLTTDLVDSKPLADANIQVFDYQNQLINEGKSDKNGLVQLDMFRTPFLAVAQKDGQKAYLKLQDGDALSLSNFDVAGAAAKEGLKGFIYGERGVWRPGDTLHLNFVLEDQFKKIAQGTPVFMELLTPQGQLFATLKPQQKKGPIYYFEPHTDKESPTGNWLCRVHAGGATFTKNLKIETVKPNRLKIDLTFDDEILKSGEGNYADLAVRWLHGATARNLDAKFEMSVSEANTKFDNFLAYEFDDQAKDFYSAKKVIFDSKIDNQGNARFPIKVENTEQAPGMLNLRLSGKVFEEGGDFSIGSAAVSYSPYESYVGINVPSTEENSRVPLMYTSKDNTIQFAAVNQEGEPLANKNIKIELYKLNWRWWWDYGNDNVSNYVSRSYNKPVSTYSVSTDQNGKASKTLNINNNEWGRYYIRVKDKESGHTSGQIAYFRRSDWYGTMAKSMGGADLLNFNLSADKGKTGEKVQVIIPGGKEGHAYISLETGKAVIQEHYIPLDDEQTVFEFELTEAMTPNVYVHVAVIQPHEQLYNDLPIRLYGVRNIMVEDAGTKLLPELKIAKNAQPGETIQFEVSEKNNQPMAYTVALVDEGLLGLTNYKTPQPWDHFYEREALGVKTWDLFEDVMSSFTGKYGKLLAVGGDEAGPLEEKSESRFKPVVGFMGPYYVEAGKQKQHQFTIPQYIGELRVMLIAANEAGQYGATDASLAINQPLMMLATLPRVMGPGETTQMPVTIFVRDPSITKATITVNTTGQLNVVGTKSKTVSLNRNAETIVYFPIEAVNALGNGKVQIKAASGKHQAVYDVAMQVRPSNPMMLAMQDQLLEKGESWKLAYKPLGMTATNEATVELSTLPALNLEQRTDYLIRYPHGCVEQTTSSVFAQLFLPDLLPIESSRKFEIQNNINAAISRLRNFQVSDGGFAYWPGRLTANEWGTNYAGHFLLMAKKKGYQVPNDMIQNFVSFQKRLANEWTGSSSGYRRSDLVQAYRLFSLALHGSPAMSAMNRMRERNDLSVQARWMLANAYAQAGHTDVGLKMVENATKTIEAYRELGGTFGSSVRDQAIILETLVKLGKRKEAFEMLNQLAKTLGDADQWLSTQTTAYCLIAVAAYTEDFPSSASLQANLSIDGEDHLMQTNGYFTQYLVEQPDAGADLSITNKIDAPIYARLIRQGIPLEGVELPDDSHLKIDVKYYDANDNEMKVENITQGTDFKAIVTVSNPGSRGNLEQLALTQIFPSGWEILNSRITGGSESKDGATYKDIRDDRVLTYFDLNVGKSKRFEVNLNAAYQGKYYLPAVQAEAMYDKSIFASVRGKWVNVVK